MSLVIYNTMTRKKEEFKPWNPPAVKMYCCGPTVYDFLHVGNFRGAIFYNLVRNWLSELGYQVKMVYNYTDVDDKIINRAHAENVSAQEIAEKYMTEFQKDFNSLGLRPHDVNPRVSETMTEIKEFVSDLIQKKVAYPSINGDVWYSIPAFPEYGKLSNRKTEELQAGVRIEKDEHKQNPLDFVLWKHAKPNEPSWDSPWGPGRPGWHIECSAMAKKHLGEQIDIHGGGLDLMFPHHENEIAQSEGLSGKPFVKYWIHNNMIQLGGSKMSKSVGNIMSGRDFMATYNPEILKFMLLSVHYRSVSDLSESAIENAIKGLARIYSAISLAEDYVTEQSTNDLDFQKIAEKSWVELSSALNDDFNTPEAFSKIYDLVRSFNSLVKRGTKKTPQISNKAFTFLNFIKRFGALAALFQERARVFLIALDDMLLKSMNLERESINKLVQERFKAREQKDFKKSDELRDQLLKMGIAVMDTAQGSFWEVAK